MRHKGDVYVVAAAQRSFEFNRGVYAAEPATKYQDPAEAIRASFRSGRTPASIIMIFSLIQLTRPPWNPRN